MRRETLFVEGLPVVGRVRRADRHAVEAQLERPLADAYREASGAGYRFYSYGDAMLIERAA